MGELNFTNKRVFKVLKKLNNKLDKTPIPIPIPILPIILNKKTNKRISWSVT
jgi:hypothetical protein